MKPPGKERTMRLFLAAWPDERAREALSGLIRPLTAARGISWVEPANLHLTLKFLGDVSMSDFGRVLEAAEEAAEAACPAYLTVEGPGAFPPGSSPRVLVFNFVADEEFERARRIGRAVETAFEAAGFPGERRGFNPHATVGRVRPDTRGRPEVSEAVRGFLTGLRVPAGLSWDLEEITLVESKLSRTGAEYSVLATFPLTGEEPGGTGEERE